MSGLCIIAGKLLASIPIASFTLASIDPIDRSRNVVEWRIVGERLISSPEPQQAQRDSQSNLAMSIQLGAQTGNKKSQNLPQLMLTHATEAAQHELCLDGRCRPIASLLPGIEPYAVIELRACPKEK
jgi:hypothetical protein